MSGVNYTVTPPPSVLVNGLVCIVAASVVSADDLVGGRLGGVVGCAGLTSP